MFNPLHQQNEDYLIQIRLLVLMTVFEVLLAGAAIIFLYFRLETIIDAQIYRFHNTGMPVLQEYWLTITITLGTIVAFNLAAIVVAHYIWVKYVNRVIARLGHDLERIARLDFSSAHASEDAIHPVLQDLHSWIEAERKLNTTIHQSLAEIRTNSDPEHLLAWTREMADRLTRIESQPVTPGNSD